MGAIPYFAFGGRVADNVALTITNGPLKVTTEIMLLLHLVAAFPILLNPPAQYFENLLKIPMGKCRFSILLVWSFVKSISNRSENQGLPIED